MVLCNCSSCGLQVRDGRLTGELPVMIDAGEEGQEWEEPAEELDDIFIGDADLWYDATLPFRTATSKASHQAASSHAPINLADECGC